MGGIDGDDTVVEELTFEVEAEVFERWLEREAATWDAFLAAQEGYLGKEVWLDADGWAADGSTGRGAGGAVPGGPGGGTGATPAFPEGAGVAAGRGGPGGEAGAGPAGGDGRRAVRVLVWWASLAQWKAVDPEAVAATERAMGDLLRDSTCRAYRLVRRVRT